MKDRAATVTEQRLRGNHRSLGNGKWLLEIADCCLVKSVSLSLLRTQKNPPCDCFCYLPICISRLQLVCKYLPNTGALVKRKSRKQTGTTRRFWVQLQILLCDQFYLETVNLTHKPVKDSTFSPSGLWF